MTETLDEVLTRLGFLDPKGDEPTTQERLVAAIERVQLMYFVHDEIHVPLMIENSDWIIILQCLQDHQMFVTNPKRPPLLAFQKWIESMHIRQFWTVCSAETMSKMNRKLAGERYPWDQATFIPQMYRYRWKRLYNRLDIMLTTIQQTQTTHTDV